MALPAHIPNLTPLRALAALAVIFFHKLTLYSGVNPNNGGYEKALDIVFNKGHLGVNFFFVLSGFLITYLMIREQQKHGRFNVGGFIARRVLRIWPVYFIVVIFGFAILPSLSGHSHPHDLGYFLGFLSNFEEILNGASSDAHSLTVLWSVSIEEQFYLGWALILGLTQLPTKYYQHVFYGIIIASVAFRLVNIDDERVLYFSTLSVISDMAIGGLLAYFMCFSGGFRKRIEDLPRWLIGGAYIIGILFCLAHNKIMKAELYAFDRVLTGLFWAFIIAEQSFAKNSLFKLGKWPGLQYLGKISYGLYAYHLIVFFLINELWFPSAWSGNIGMDLVVNTTVVLVGTVLVASASYHLIEAPILKLKQRFYPSSEEQTKEL